MAKELKFKSINPLFNCIIVTKDTYEEDCVVKYGNLYAWDHMRTKGKVKPYQTVIAAGPMSKVKAGDKVYLNLLRYAIPEDGSTDEKSLKNYGKTQGERKGVHYKYDFTGLEYEIDGKEYLMLFDSDVQFTFEGEEVEVELPEYLKNSKEISTSLKVEKPRIVDSNGKPIK